MRESCVIGGVFPLPVTGARAGAFPPLDAPRTTLLVNGRSAIDHVLRGTKTRRFWLPSYICASVVEAAGQREIDWYDVGDELTPTDDSWLADLLPGDAVLFVNYFGWRESAAWYARAAARGASVIEDGSQSLLSAGLGEGAHFHFTVPRKFVGVPDGALLVQSGTLSLPPVTLAPPPDDWWRTAYSANAGRRDFDLGGADRDWFASFGEAEAKQPLGPVAMSDYSRDLLGRAFDFSAIAARRRQNYSSLASALGAMALRPELPDGVVPLGFPVRMADRDRRRHALFDLGIFPPVHWPLADIVPARFEASHQLSREIMTLPCDQRYGRDEMDLIIKAIMQ